MKPIGGYFELELPSVNPTPLTHKGIWVNTGRNALEYILLSIGIKNISKIYLPYYTCEVVLQPIINHEIKYEFYHINSQLKVAEELNLKEGEFIIINNYFGILDKYIASLTDKYLDRIIVDNSQALMASAISCQMTFYSPRKFVGIPDGGIAYSPHNFDIQEQENEIDSISRSSHLLKRLYGTPQEGYSDFKVNSNKLNNLPVKKMSAFTQAMLNSIDFENVVKIRKENYDTLRNALEPFNRLSTPESKDISCPMVYPFFTADNTLRKRLIDNQIFVATYWPNVFDWCDTGNIEAELAQNCLPIPIDQRYTKNDINEIITVVSESR